MAYPRSPVPVHRARHPVTGGPHPSDSEWVTTPKGTTRIQATTAAANWQDDRTSDPEK